MCLQFFGSLGEVGGGETGESPKAQRLTRLKCPGQWRTQTWYQTRRKVRNNTEVVLCPYPHIYHIHTYPQAHTTYTHMHILHRYPTNMSHTRYRQTHHICLLHTLIICTIHFLCTYTHIKHPYIHLHTTYIHHLYHSPNKSTCIHTACRYTIHT